MVLSIKKIICISNKFPGDTEAAGSRATLLSNEVVDSVIACV